ncbi:GmrSD restriction endonuclease domain-containing protein [Nonomuraea sp. CA-218870]|uniref:GmrSD restriction endonuclease domain-containing protein n=1 Tax=Nonomuraea sp. CA-218870 TaxID=3239998 RepID=UPI003D8B0E16
MAKTFESGEIPLADLLNQAHQGILQLPDFQRGWVWDDDHIVSLLASVSRSFPIGAVMTLETGNADVRFQPRPLEGVPSSAAAGEPKYLLLDGQQRTTSLYLALRSAAPVPTRDTRKKDIERWYFADIDACIDPDADRSDAILSLPADKRRVDTRGNVVLDASATRVQVRAGKAGLFPLDIVLNPAATTDWQLAYLMAGAPEEQVKIWKRFQEALILPFLQYSVPRIALDQKTTKEAVCQVFEKVNTGGVELTVFELLTATYAAENFRLRDDWERRQAVWVDEPLLADLDATTFLQIVTLLWTRSRWEERTRDRVRSDRVPAVSAKRRDMLSLPLSEYWRWADAVTHALQGVVRFLQRERIFRARDLPYSTQLVPLTAILTLLGEAAFTPEPTAKLRQWYWCGVFGELYGGTTETRFANDLQDVLAWVQDNGEEPRTVRESQFQAERLLGLRTRNSAAYKGLYALVMKRGGRDFRTGETIDAKAYAADSIDIRHIFPQKWCAANSIDSAYANCIVNKTAIDGQTWGYMGASAPSKYLTAIEAGVPVSPQDLDAICNSHDIDPVALRQDDFGAVFDARFERLIRQIEDATGRPVNRGDGQDSPFSVHRGAAALARGIESLIKAGESKVVEFKSTGRKNLDTGQKDQAMEWAIIKTIAGFMNGHGGTLLVGVQDDGSVLGLEEDLTVFSKKNTDGWEQWLTGLLIQTFGKAATANVTVAFGIIDGRTVARINVAPASAPVYTTRTKTGAKGAVFLVRLNNTTHELDGPEASKYQHDRWFK